MAAIVEHVLAIPEAAMKVSVDPLVCEANGVCVGIAPDVFELDDDDELHITQPEADLERVAQAVASCPKMALSVTD
jgi:ferredoxin